MPALEGSRITEKHCRARTLGGIPSPCPIVMSDKFALSMKGWYNKTMYDANGTMNEESFVKLMRGVFRNLQTFRSVYEETGNDTLVCNDMTLNLFDMERLYAQRRLLSLRQQEAIELFLEQDIKEKDVAIMMGVSETNPVAIYATQGLKKMYHMIDTGVISGFDDLIRKVN